ncbi:unnamed protein product, partial [Iphiclides podalirius]
MPLADERYLRNGNDATHESSKQLILAAGEIVRCTRQLRCSLACPCVRVSVSGAGVAVCSSVCGPEVGGRFPKRVRPPELVGAC